MRRMLIFLVCCLSSTALANSEDPPEQRTPLPTIASKTRDLLELQGLLSFHVDRQRGRIWLETPSPDPKTGEVGRYLYIEGLTTGLGANDVGLDRSQIGSTQLVALRRVGGRILVEAINLNYRALSNDGAERRAVRESFASSILWAGKIEAEDLDGRALVDFTSFIVRDAHKVVQRLKRTGQGDFKLDLGRSVVDENQCLAFPDNVEFEALLTFSSMKPGRQVRATTPVAESVTLVQHHSFVRLPDDRYVPRRFDPRTSSYAIRFTDYAADLSKPIEKRWIVRHRLEKTDPSARRSKPKNRIVYYVDPGVPEPVRTALIEGASWWNQAFEAAGFIDAFAVEVLPPGAHPLDVRYNVIQWVHRSTRGWSYGGTVTDPRTGEIIKGHVLLGSLRVRQDRLLFEGLFGTDRTGSGLPDDPIQLSLARIRQLSAHEVGHTLGFSHNFAASTYANRASVMDYPAPLIQVTNDGRLDSSDAYGVGIGVWDKLAVRYAYSHFPPGTDQQTELGKIIREGFDKGWKFLSDADARPAGAAHPLANLWDNGSDPVLALRHSLRVRDLALRAFGERNVQRGTPLAKLQEVFVPVYLHHRYQLGAALKVIGGATYTYALRGDGQDPLMPIDGKSQRHALAAVLGCLSPKVLDISDEVLKVIQPRPFGYGASRELFSGSTGLVFDPLSAAATAADLVVGGLLQSQRCARLVDYHRRNPALPGLIEVLEQLVERTFESPNHRLQTGATLARYEELQRVVQQVVVNRLITRSSEAATPSNVRSRLRYALIMIRERVLNGPRTDATQTAHADFLDAQIIRFIDQRLESAKPHPGAQDVPPGSPIGSPSIFRNDTFERLVPPACWSGCSSRGH